MWRCTAPYVCEKVVHVTVHVDWGGGGGVADFLKGMFFSMGIFVLFCRS